MVFLIDTQELKPGLIIFRRADVKHRPAKVATQLYGIPNRSPHLTFFPKPSPPELLR